MRSSLRHFRLLVSIALLWIAPARLVAQEGADFEVREWVIFVADPNQARINTLTQGRSTLPDFASTVREKTAFDEKSLPSPVGILRMTGTTDQRISVKLSGPSVLFSAYWPPAASRTVEVGWRDLVLSSQPGVMETLDSRHWLSPLRDGKYSFIHFGNRSERFLLYDVGFLYVTPLKLTESVMPDKRVLASNTGPSPLRDLVLYRRDASGWQKGEVAQVLAADAAAPTTQIHSDVIFTPVSASAPIDVCSDWKTRLADCELDPTDLDLIVRTLAAHALDERQMTAVYRLDREEMERLLHLEVVPQPRRIRRVALVVVRNIDPALPTLIDALVAQLGDNDWRQREAASQMLAQMGRIAEPKLRAALQSRDPEVAMRAERLLAPARPAPVPQPAGTLIIR